MTDEGAANADDNEKQKNRAKNPQTHFFTITPPYFKEGMDCEGIVNIWL
jgi:hypothetical protein